MNKNYVKQITRKLRSVMKITQDELAHQLNVEERTVRRYEAGQSRWSSTVLIKIIGLCRQNGIEFDLLLAS